MDTCLRQSHDDKSKSSSKNNFGLILVNLMENEEELTNGLSTHLKKYFNESLINQSSHTYVSGKRKYR